MQSPVRCLPAVMALLLVSGCAASVPGLYPPARDEGATVVYLVDHGQHTGLILPVEAIPTRLWPEVEDLRGFRSVEVGWGDDDFYRGERPTCGTALKAACWPTQSVLHVVAIQGPVEQRYPPGALVRIRLSDSGFHALCRFISDSHARTAPGRATPLESHASGRSRFYRARGAYCFPHTCNTWTARALRSAGCPITPVYAMTAGNVMYQARKIGDAR